MVGTHHHISSVTPIHYNTCIRLFHYPRNQTVQMSNRFVCVYSFVILKNAFFHFLLNQEHVCSWLNQLLVKTWVLLINNCDNFCRNFLVAEKLQCKVSRQLEISSVLLMLAENTETLTFVSLKLCFLGFVHCDNEFFFSYLWSYICKFTSSEKMRIRVDEERTPTHCLLI